MKLHLPKQLFTALLAAITLAAPAWGDWSGNSYYVTGAENESFSTENGTTDNTAAGLLFVRVDAPAGTPTTKTATISTLTLAQKNEAYTLRISGHWDDPSKMFEALTIEDLASEATNAILEIYGGNTVSVQALTGTLNSLTNGGNLTLGTTEDTTNSFELGDITNSGTLTIHGDVTADSIVNDSITTIGRLADPENDISAIAPTVNVGSATISSGASLNILNGSLTSTGDFTNNGSLTVNSGASLISNGTFTNAAGASITINGNFTNSGTLVLGSTMLGTGTVTNSGNGVIKLGDYSLLNFANVTYVGGGTSGFIDSLSVFADTLTYSGSVYVGDTAYTVTDGNITLNGADKTYYVNEDLTYDADTMGGATHYSVEEGGVFDFTGYDLGDENTATNDKTLIGIMNKMSGAGTVKLASGAVIQTQGTRYTVNFSTNYKVTGDDASASLTLTSWKYDQMSDWRTWQVNENGSITVGNNGEGTLSILAGQRLSIQNGGQVSVGTLKLGYNDTSYYKDNPGSLVMSGSGSKLTVGGIVMQNGIDGTVLNEVSITGGTLKVTGATAITYNAANVKTTVTLGGSDAASSVLLQTGTATGWVMSKQSNAASTFNVGYVTIDGANTQSITFNGATLTGAITNNASLILGEDVVWSGATVSNAGTLQINKGAGDLVLNDQLGKNLGAYNPSAVTNTAAGNLVLANTGNKTLSGAITLANGGKVTLKGGTFGTADAAITNNIVSENGTTLVLDGVEAYLRGSQILQTNLELNNGTVLHLLSNDVLTSSGANKTTMGADSAVNVGATRQSLKGTSLEMAGGTIFGSGGAYSDTDGNYVAGLDFYESGTISVTQDSTIATSVASRNDADVVTLNIEANKTLTFGTYTDAAGQSYTAALVGVGKFSKAGAGTVVYAGEAFTNEIGIEAGVFEYNVTDTRSHTGGISGAGTFRKSGSGTLTLDSANTSVTTLNVAGGKLVYSSSTDTTHTISGASGSTFEKTGSGILTANTNNYEGEILVSAGTLKNNAENDADQKVTVATGATVDVNGMAAFYNLTLQKGATLTNSVTSGSETGTGKKQLHTITLKGDAKVTGSSELGMVGSGHVTSNLYLNGHTLTKEGSNTFHLFNTTVQSQGLIQVNGGTVKAHGNNSGTLNLTLASIGINGGTFELGHRSQSIQNLTLTSGTLTIGSGLTLTTMGDVSMSGGTVSGNLCLSGTITLNGSVNMGSATLSGTSLGGFTRVESAEQPATSGLQTLTYQLWSGDGSITSSQSTISVGGVNYEMNAATGTFTTAGTVYYVATGDTITVGGDSADEGTASATSFVVDGSLSVAADTSTESINGSAGTVNVAESTTLTLTGTGSSIGTLSATNGTVALAAGSSLYLGQTGENAQETTSSIGTVNVAGASTIHLNEKATLSAISKTGNGSITLNGSGVYEAGAVNTLSSGLSLGAGWAGTVVVSGTHSADIKLNTLGRAGSTVEIAEAGISGYFENADATFNPNLKLTGNLKLSNGYSNADYVFAGTVSGGGTLEIARTGGSPNSFTFTNSIAGWEGTLLHSSGQTDTVIFTGAADTINATINRTGGTLNITVNNEATFNKAVTASSITVNNEATFKSAVTSEALTGSGSVVLNGSDAAYTITGTSNKVITPEVTLVDGASLKLATSGNGYTTTLGKMYIDGTGNICSDQVSAGWQTQLTIGELYSLSAGAVLNLSSSANTTQRAIVDLNGGDFNGTINVSGSSKTSGRQYALNINDRSVAADAVILLNGTASSNKVALGIGDNEVRIKGIQDQTNATGTMQIVSGQQAFGTADEFASDTTFRTLVIDTDGTDNAVSENSATSASLGSYLNLEKQGVGTQTFSGNVGAFNGTLNVQGGTLAFTGSGNMTATGVSVADGANLTLGGTVGLILAGGTADAPATYSISSLTSAGNTITVSEHAALNTLSNLSGTVALAGSGLYELQDGAITMTSGVSLSDNWTGTVKMSNVAYDGSSVANNKMETMANTAGSGKLMLTNVNGWLGTGTMSKHLILENGTGGEAALYLSNGSSQDNTTKTAIFSGGISGTGDIQFNWNKTGVSNCTLAHTISGDTASWSGKFISNESGSLDVQVDFTKGGEVFSSTVDGGGVENRTDNKLTVNVGSSDADTSFNGSIGKTSGAGAVELNVTHNNVTFNKTVNVDKLTVAQGASAQLGNTMTVGGVSFSASESATAESPAKLVANGSSALAQLQADASFTIQDMTLTNTTITAATPTTQVKLQNVTATDLALAQGKFTMNAAPTVGTYNPETATGTLSYSNGLGVQTGASLTLNLDVMSAVTPEQHGVYDITVTLSGFGSDFTIESLDAIRGMVDFDPSSWLAQALVSQKAEYTVVTEQTPASSGESGVPTVSYAAGTGSNVGRLTITISGLNVPEPTTSTLSLIALAALTARRRRK